MIIHLENQPSLENCGWLDDCEPCQIMLLISKGMDDQNQRVFTDSTGTECVVGNLNGSN